MLRLALRRPRDGRRRLGSSHQAAELARHKLLEWHNRFSRFLPASELSLLNGDERRAVPASPLMCLLARAVRAAGAATGGLVDGTLLDELEGAGYAADLDEPLGLEQALAMAPRRRPARRPRRAAGR